MLMWLQAKKLPLREVLTRSSTKQKISRQHLAFSIFPSAHQPGVTGEVDTPGWCHGLSHGEPAASVTASGTDACGSGDKIQIAPFLVPRMLRGAGSATRNGCLPMFIVSLSQS